MAPSEKKPVELPDDPGDLEPRTNYDASAIKVLTFPEAVRKRPGMFFGDIETGLEHLVGELTSNAIDQFLAGHATSLRISISGREILAEDDGAGLPFDRPIRASEKSTEDCNESSLASLYLTRMHSTPSADHHAPHIHVHSWTGIGLAATNSVCERFVCSSWRQGHLWRQEFSRGKPLGTARKIQQGQGRGTTIEITPDSEIWGDRTPRLGAIRARLLRSAHLFPGLRIEFNGERFHAPEGLAAMAFLEAPESTTGSRPLHPFNLNVTTEDLVLQVAMLGEASKTRWMTWANGFQTAYHGSHRDGARLALRGLGWTPAVALVHVVMKDPAYAGPSRERLDVPLLKSAIRSAMRAPLERFVECFRAEEPAN